MVEDSAFRLAVVRRLGGGLRRTSAAQQQPLVCQLAGPAGPCGRPLTMHHACSCGVGGGAVRRRNRLA
eukprot:3516236-Alexandrium_andersonii.AAC.1